MKKFMCALLGANLYIAGAFALDDAAAQKALTEARTLAGTPIQVTNTADATPARPPETTYTIERHPTEAVHQAYDVAILSDTATTYHLGTDNPQNIALKDTRMAVDVENTSLKEVIDEIIGQAAEVTGPWQVKWRLKPENQDILRQKVNLIAEATFDEFIYHLTDRIKNITGTQLFVSTFNAARVIIITDTYY